MTILRAREDHEPFELSTHSIRNLLQPCQLNANKKGLVAFKLFKNGNPYTIMEFGNKEVPHFNPLIGHRYKNCSNEVLLLAFWFILWSSRQQVYVGTFILDASKCPRFRCRDNQNVFLKV